MRHGTRGPAIDGGRRGGGALAAAAVISLATDTHRYPEALARLLASLDRVRFAGKVLSWGPGSFPAGCPSHEEVPFAFKPYCFQAARARGLQLALWLDASCVVVRDLDALFGAIRERGYLLFRNQDHRVGEWASDEALAVFALGREEALQIPEIDAAALGLDLLHPLGREFFERWHAAAVDGVAFRGTREPLRSPQDYGDVKWNRAQRVSSDPRVRGHRHDQTVAGLLAHRLGMTPTPVGLQKYSRRLRRIRWRTVVVVDRDVGRSRIPLRSVGQIRRDRYLGALARLLIALGRGGG